MPKSTNLTPVSPDNALLSSRKLKKERPNGSDIYEKTPEGYAEAVSALRALHLLRLYHKEYIAHFRKITLQNLSRLDPYKFEYFAQRFLLEYGFTNVETTKRSNDGGIDGHGKLVNGLATFSVAFQCKRWKRIIDRPEIDRFRGAIEGTYEKGLFFTTSRFSQGAKDCSSKAGVVEVILIDGPRIVDLMIEKGFGVETEVMNTYRLTLDRELANQTETSQ